MTTIYGIKNCDTMSEPRPGRGKSVRRQRQRRATTDLSGERAEHKRGATS